MDDSTPVPVPQYGLKMNQFKLAILLLLALSCAFGCSKGNSKLVVFHAGSLAGPMQDLAAEFEKLHPEVEVLREASGSMVAARKVSELGRKADVIALADSNVIERLLIPGSPGAMGSGKHADWYLNFARNRMVIAFTERSKYANEVDADNWYRILARKDVRFGRSDHNLDPCGYRTLMLWQLADMFYKD